MPRGSAWSVRTVYRPSLANLGFRGQAMALGASLSTAPTFSAFATYPGYFIGCGLDLPIDSAKAVFRSAVGILFHHSEAAHFVVRRKS